MQRTMRVSVLIAVSFSLLLLDRNGLLGIVKQPLEFVVLPLKQTVRTTAVALSQFYSIAGSYSSIAILREEKLKLTQTNEELVHAALVLHEENEQLRKQLGASLPPSFKLTPANVIAVSDVLEVSAGKKEGIVVGNSVIVGSTMIGKVTNVSEYRSQIALLSEGTVEVPVRTTRGARGIVASQSDNIVIGNVLQKDPLFLEDQVFTSGEGGFPPSLLIGKISHIAVSDVSVYKQAIITSPVALQTLKTVFIITQS